VEQGVYNTKVAIKWAQDMELDLIEISPNADPPVCKILDFNKFLYQQKKKQKEIKANTAKTVIKEIRFGPNTDEHDMDFKLKHAKKFLEEGSKVKAYVFFKGRSIVFKDRGELLLLNFIKDLADYGVPEELPKLIGKRMTVMISPARKKK
jgi:translation initiation factor IF-3